MNYFIKPSKASLQRRSTLKALNIKNITNKQILNLKIVFEEWLKGDGIVKGVVGWDEALHLAIERRVSIPFEIHFPVDRRRVVLSW